MPYRECDWSQTQELAEHHVEACCRHIRGISLAIQLPASVASAYPARLLDAPPLTAQLPAGGADDGDDLSLPLSQL